MKVLVAGATGVVGGQLVPALVARGHEVSGLTRSPGKSDAVRALGARPVIADTARYTLARFRAEHARRYGDPAFTSLITELLAASAYFRELWPRHEVLSAQLGTKAMEHPRLGRLTLHHLQSVPTSHPDLRLTQFVPADAATRAALSDQERSPVIKTI